MAKPFSRQEGHGEKIEESRGSKTYGVDEQRHRAIYACTSFLVANSARPFHLEGDSKLKATWWVDYMMEPPNYPSELPTITPYAKKGGETMAGLVDAYINRVTFCLAKYFQLREEDQRYIVAAREDNLRWRGDDMEFFHTVAELTLRWRDMSDDEKATMKAETIRKAHNILPRVSQKTEKKPSHTIHIDPMERSRQLEALYSLMTPEQRQEYDNRKRLT